MRSNKTVCVVTSTLHWLSVDGKNSCSLPCCMLKAEKLPAGVFVRGCKGRVLLIPTWCNGHYWDHWRCWAIHQEDWYLDPQAPELRKILPLHKFPIQKGRKASEPMELGIELQTLSNSIEKPFQSLERVPEWRHLPQFELHWMMYVLKISNLRHDLIFISLYSVSDSILNFDHNGMFYKLCNFLLQYNW